MAHGFLAQRLNNLGTETAFEVLSRAKRLEAQGRRIIHMEIGEPDFHTPAHIREAAVRALADGHTHYVPAPGIPELRAAIADYTQGRHGIDVDPDEVVVTPGGKPIMFFTIMATINPGDEVIYPDPGFPIYESCIRFAGGIPVPVPLREELDFRLDVSELASLITPRTKMIILNSPGNPCGGVLDADDITAIAELVRGRPILILSDEIYDRIVYGDIVPLSVASIPGMKEQTIILNGFSKTYAMTGWRIGWGVMPAVLAEQVTKLMINSVSCTAAFTQWAALAALQGPQDEVNRMVIEFKRRRDRIVAGLNAIPGVNCKVPAGAFYVFPNVKSFGKSSAEIASYLLEEAGVAVLAGTAFGRGGEGYLRLSYATGMEEIEEALAAMTDAFRKWQR